MNNERASGPSGRHYALLVVDLFPSEEMVATMKKCYGTFQWMLGLTGLLVIVGDTIQAFVLPVYNNRQATNDARSRITHRLNVLSSSEEEEEEISSLYDDEDESVFRAYEEWRWIFNRPFDAVRYKQFQQNFWTLSRANMEASIVAFAQGRPETQQWLTLNEYGDFSQQEYKALMGVSSGISNEIEEEEEENLGDYIGGFLQATTAADTSQVQPSHVEESVPPNEGVQTTSQQLQVSSSSSSSSSMEELMPPKDTIQAPTSLQPEVESSLEEIQEFTSPEPPKEPETSQDTGTLPGLSVSKEQLQETFETTTSSFPKRLNERPIKVPLSDKSSSPLSSTPSPPPSVSTDPSETQPEVLLRPSVSYLSSIAKTYVARKAYLDSLKQRQSSNSGFSQTSGAVQNPPLTPSSIPTFYDNYKAYQRRKEQEEMAVEASSSTPQPTVSFLNAITNIWANRGAYLESLKGDRNIFAGPSPGDWNNNNNKIYSNTSPQTTPNQNKNPSNSFLARLFSAKSENAQQQQALIDQRKKEYEQLKQMEQQLAQEAAELEKAADIATAAAQKWEAIQKKLEAKAEILAETKQTKETFSEKEEAQSDTAEASKKTTSSPELSKQQEEEESIPDELVLLPSVSYMSSIAKTWVGRASYLESLRNSSSKTSDVFAGPSPEAWRNEAQAPTPPSIVDDSRAQEETLLATTEDRLLRLVEEQIAEDERAAERAKAEAQEWENIQKQLEVEIELVRLSRENED